MLPRPNPAFGESKAQRAGGAETVSAEFEKFGPLVCGCSEWQPWNLGDGHVSFTVKHGDLTMEKSATAKKCWLKPGKKNMKQLGVDWHLPRRGHGDLLPNGKPDARKRNEEGTLPMYCWLWCTFTVDAWWKRKNAFLAGWLCWFLDSSHKLTWLSNWFFVTSCEFGSIHIIPTSQLSQITLFQIVNDYCVQTNMGDPNCQVFNGFWPACQIRHLEPPHCPGCFSLAWCGCPGGEDGRRRPAPTITIITGQMRLTIHHSGWWFQNVWDVLERFVYMSIPTYPRMGWLEHTGAQFLQLRQIFRGSTTNQLEWGFEANSAVHEHVKQCEMLRSLPAKWIQPWLLSIWIAAPPAVGNMESPHSWKSWGSGQQSDPLRPPPRWGVSDGEAVSSRSCLSVQFTWPEHGMVEGFDGRRKLWTSMDQPI